MNEFIVWDNQEKIFLTKDTDFDDIVIEDSFYEFDAWYPVSEASVLFNILKINEWWINRFTIHKSIGKTDINNKKIYADCSIVKVYDKKSKFFNDICIVRYDKNICSYMLYSVDFEDNTQEHIKADYANRYYEVIDTIQENKLGLIKDN